MPAERVTLTTDCGMKPACPMRMRSKSVAFAMLAAGTGLFVLGIAGLLGMLFGNFWVGATVVGLLMFILVGVGAWIGLTIMNKSAYKALRLKYADRRQRQKKMYGRDVKEVARG